MWIINSHIEGLVVSVHRIGHQGHRIWTHCIIMCGVTWTLWCMHTRWAREKNYPTEFSAMEEASWTLQCFVRLQDLCSHKRQNASKQTEDRYFEKFAWVLNGQSVIVHLTTYINKCTTLLFPFKFIYCTLKNHKSWTFANWTHVYMTFWLNQ